MPSVNSRSIPKVCDSSTLTTPSLPTLSMASAMTLPISSERALIAPTRDISSFPLMSVACSLMASTAAATALCMPARRMTGFAPAATFLRPSCTMICARTVAVVVPSPATSLVLVATSLTSCAPWFSKMSSSSISRAMVTPSLVIVGDPNFLSKTTYWPLGPSVTLTASASLFTPASSARRASLLNLSSLCATQNLLCYTTIHISGLTAFLALSHRECRPPEYKPSEGTIQTMNAPNNVYEGVFRPGRLPSLSRLPKELGREERYCEPCGKETVHILYLLPKKWLFVYVKDHPENVHATCIECARSTVLSGEERDRALSPLGLRG